MIFALSPTGTMTYDLRFRGQFFDQGTKPHYNYFRDYDPRTGRYIESDPSASRTYAYAGSNLLVRTDASGLFTGTLFDKRYDEVLGITHCWYKTPLGDYAIEVPRYCSCPDKTVAPF
ncbi:MAG TPA: RHS repeat-associated core domain-containing protein [Methylocella sp.]|nr:RHS repeat-associated core domain-containing protein [Methylocella sp.]